MKANAWCSSCGIKTSELSTLSMAIDEVRDTMLANIELGPNKMIYTVQLIICKEEENASEAR